jgi:hypothetical protein
METFTFSTREAYRAYQAILAAKAGAVCYLARTHTYVFEMHSQYNTSTSGPSPLTHALDGSTPLLSYSSQFLVFPVSSSTP